MLRTVLAAVAGGIALQLWVLGSFVLLPQFTPAAPPSPAPAKPARKPPPPPPSPFILEDVGTPVVTDSPLAALPSPNPTNHAPSLQTFVDSVHWRNVALAFFVGLVAALMAVALPEATPLWRQWSLVLLIGIFAALLGHFCNLANPDESRAQLLAGLANQFGGGVLVAAVAAPIARCRWLAPRRGYSRTS